MHCRYRFSKSLVIIVVIVMYLGTGLADLAAFASQEGSKVDPDFSFSCTQNNRQFILKTRLSQWTGERDAPIGGSVITYYNVSGEESRQLGAVPTDMDGEAVLKIDKGSDSLVGSEDIYIFRALFGGSPEFEMTEDQLEVKPLIMNLEFIEIDSVKTILAEAFEVDHEGNHIPLEDADVYFYVPRSFSLLPVGEEWFMGGEAQVDFPTSLPGDSAGNLTIIARIPDHELYGNVEAVAAKDWGKAVPRVVVKKRRGLGDTDAPLWMVYTLIVLLSIVWFHYLYVFYLMTKIKRLRRN